MSLIKKYKDLFIFSFFIFICGFYSLHVGMDRMADVCNYHIYNPWAFLNNRIGYDIMPAGIQSYFNPLLDTFYFLMIKHMNNHPCLATFIMGFGYALFLFFVYKIAELIFENYHKYQMTWFCTLIASLTYIVYRHVGWLSQDLFVNALGLWAVYLILKALKTTEFNAKNIIISGVLLGTACGLRLASTVFTIPLFFSLLFFIKKFDKPYKTLFLFTTSIGLAFLTVNGFWMYKLYVVFGNPFFPYFNHIFHSTYVSADNVFSIDFNHTKDWHVYWLFPFCTKWYYWMKILYFVFFINLFTIPFFNADEYRKTCHIEPLYINFLFVYIFCSYIYWVNTFMVHRYAIFTAGLSGIIIFAFIHKCHYIIFKYANKSSNYTKNGALVLLFLIITLLLLPKTKYIKNTLRINPYNTNKILYIENKQLPDKASVIISDNCAITAVFQNPSAKYIYLNRINYNRHGLNILSETLKAQIRKTLLSNPDRIYIISRYNIAERKNLSIEEIRATINEFQEYNKNFDTMSKKLKLDYKSRKNLFDKKYSWTNLPPDFSILDELANYGIDITSSKCELIDTNIKNNYYLCKLRLK